MGNTLSSDLALRPGSTSQFHASAAPDTPPGAAARAALDEPQMLRAMPESPVTTDSIPISSCAALGATCCATPPSQASDANPESPLEHPMLQLSSEQKQVLHLLGLGHTETSVCKRLKINRGTLYRWKTTHPRFMAELARRNALRQQSSNAAACRARDAALKIVLRQLQKEPNRSLDIAVRLLCSPQLARLASSARPVGLQEILAQIQSTRPSPTASPDDLADLLHDLNTEAAAPEPPPGPPKPEFPTFERIHAAVGRRKPRPDLYAALIGYGCIEHEITHVVRRPDLLAFDVHYYAGYHTYFARPHYTPAHKIVISLAKDGPAGIVQPLLPEALDFMIRDKHLPQIGSLDLAGCTSRTCLDVLLITDPTGLEHEFPQSTLWRDFVLGWSCEPQAVSA